MEFSKQMPTAMQIGHGTKYSKREVVCAGEKDLEDTQNSEEMDECDHKKNHAKPKEIVI